MIKNTKLQVFLLVFTIAVSSLFTAPNFINIPFLGDSKINLGLDLQGGMEVVLQVKFENYFQNYMKGIERDVRMDLYNEKIGYRDFSVHSDNIVFSLRDSKDFKMVRKILNKHHVEYNESGEIFKIKMSKTNVKDLRSKVVAQSIEVIRKRIDELGNKEIIIHGIDDDKIMLQIPGKQDPENIKRILNTQARLTFHLLDDQAYIKTSSSINPNVMPIETSNPGYYYAVLKDVIISGENLDDARTTITQDGEAGVSFVFNSKAAAIFADVTSKNVGKPFVIMLDNKVLSAPNIREPIIGGSGVISGSFTTEKANELALLLRAGALPAEIHIVQQENINPTLGRESIIAGIKCLLAGTILVLIYMIARYKFLGLITIISLVVNVLCVLAFLSIFKSTLTMPGIAGIVLTVGIAVDGNIIIYENIKYLRRKMQKYAVFLESFIESAPSIIDSNITTILACIMLYEFGFGSIRGFALTLFIGVIFAVMASLFVTKVLIGMFCCKN